ncbi:serine/threonine-protein kinase [Nocardia sp. NPDC058633]|uniref:serine/threonine-protein kinase n=1 Tax=Nocardia sp. NPDC058633 TaxID=3346568 RepID=UPI00364CF0D9
MGRYRMLATIGRGGMGQVLLGQGPDGRLVAVKQIHPQFTGSPEFRARFRREVLASQQVTGAYTAGVVDHDADAEVPWLASEYIAGPSLQEAVGEFGKLNSSGLRLLATGLAMALLEIHRTGLIHRDLKPSNVLLTNDGPRVIDFGIARALEDDVALTTTGAILGSPAYMSPEQAECRPLTPASDVFAVGAILAMAASGASPFEAASTPQVLYNVLYRTPDTSALPERLRPLVDACLAKDPAQRPTPEQLLDVASGLDATPVWPVRIRRRIADHQAEAGRWAAGIEAVDEPPPSRPAFGRPPRRAVLVVGAAAVSALVLAGIAFLGIGMDGHARAMADPPLALTADEARRLDICELLKPDVLRDFGKHTAELTRNGADGCSTIYGWDEDQTFFTFNVAVPQEEIIRDKTPFGSTIAWMPVLGQRKEAGACDRTVLTQSGLPLAITMQAQVKPSKRDGCPTAERALAAIVHRLSVNPPLVDYESDSVLLLDPCVVLDRAAVLPIIGDPAWPRVDGPHGCMALGPDGAVGLAFDDRMRPDNGSENKDKEMTVAGRTAYIDLRSPHHCVLIAMHRPTRDDRAEIIKMAYYPNAPAPDACDTAAALFAPILAKLPTS